MSKRVDYHLLPDDPVEALNVLREAAGLEPFPLGDGGQAKIAGSRPSGVVASE
ncbi:MAG: hypothetical protein ACM4D3_22665 [Candidatus Sericytochromatia bacterium]